MIDTTKKLSLEEALSAARETRALEIGTGAVRNTPREFQKQFGDQKAMIVADKNTFRAAGEFVLKAFQTEGLPMLDPFIFQSADLHAEHAFVTQLESELQRHTAIPVAVGSGTINDLTKLAAHRTNRQYMAVATAASMDGYTAFGASITFQGSKQTFTCPAPVSVVADLDIICKAPVPMNSWGYTDLVAKVTAGADWIIADVLGVEAIDPQAWGIVQSRLREMISDPAGVRLNQNEAIGHLVEGLMLGGFAMQACKSSRAASGAEHQFSHLWDMQHHTHNGHAPSHGFKVGIGTLGVTALYERLLDKSLDELDPDRCCAAWPGPELWRTQARELFGEGELANVALQEISAKCGDPKTLREQLLRLRESWPELKRRLRAQLIPLASLRKMLQTAGSPVEPEEIGISRERLRDSFRQAFFIRRRFTVLDVAVRTGLLDTCLDEIFGTDGVWSQ